MQIFEHRRRRVQSHRSHPLQRCALHQCLGSDMPLIRLLYIEIQTLAYAYEGFELRLVFVTRDTDLNQ